MQSSYTSLAYIGRAAREKILEQWKITGSRIRVRENTTLGSVKEAIPFLLKPLRINIIKGYNQLSSS